MNPPHIPGNEPDPGDMSLEPGTQIPVGQSLDHGLPDEEADKLGNFA